MNVQKKTLCGIILALLGLSGCADESPSFSLLPEQNVFMQAMNNKIDILFVIDHSSSMTPHQQNLADNFSSFIGDFQNKGYDFKIAVTTTGAYLAHPNQYNTPEMARFKDGNSSHSGVYVITPETPNMGQVFLTNVMLGLSGTGDERAFSSFREALTSPLNAGFLREDAFLAIIILSDEDDFSGNERSEYEGSDHDYTRPDLEPVSFTIDFLNELTSSTNSNRRYSVSNISILDDVCQAQHAASGAIRGRRYVELTEATEGVSGSLCDVSFANSLNSIQTKISELSTQFYLNREPIIETITVEVDGQKVPNDSINGWIYVPLSNSIRFKGTALPAQGATIVVDFDPVTVK